MQQFAGKREDAILNRARVTGREVNAALKSLTREFDVPHLPIGRESIPPERLLRALRWQAFYSIRPSVVVEKFTSSTRGVERIRHTGESRYLWRKWIPAFAGRTRKKGGKWMVRISRSGH
jgi:hypothetical protein